MFGMLHCTAWQCGMCGSNSREEGDRRPLECCSECMAKICWATGVDPADRCQRLGELCRQTGLLKEGEHCGKILRVLRRE